MAKRAARPNILSQGSFGAFVLDQLSELGDVVARPMFGGAGFYLDGVFFGLLYDKRLYFRVSPETVGEYKARKMKPFAPFGAKGDESRGYYEVPVEILESPGDLIEWARAAQRTPPLSSPKKSASAAKGRSGETAPKLGGAGSSEGGRVTRTRVKR